MAQRRAPARASKAVRKSRVPVDVAAEENGRVLIPVESEAAVPADGLSPGAKAAIEAIGGWSGLDWDETIDNLERIRRERKPSPPIEDL